MKNGLKKISPAIFVIVGICFFLPFVNITCQGAKIATLSGIQLVTGTTVEQPTMFKERKETQRVDAEPLAIFSLVSVVLGLGLSFLKGRWSSIAPALMGFTGLAFLLMLKSKIDNEVLREGGGVVQVEYGIGFWLSSMLLLFAAVWNAFLSQREKAS